MDTQLCTGRGGGCEEVLGLWRETKTEERREKRRRLGEEEASSESDSEDMEALLGRWATVQKAGPPPASKLP